MSTELFNLLDHYVTAEQHYHKAKAEMDCAADNVRNHLDETGDHEPESPWKIDNIVILEDFPGGGLPVELEVLRPSNPAEKGSL